MSSTHRIFPPSAIRIAVVAASLALGAPTSAQHRLRLPPGGSNWIPQSPLAGGLATRDMSNGGETPVSLVRALVGSTGQITNIHYTGAPIAGGTFTGGTGIIGFEQGIILGSGNIASVVGPENLLASTTTFNATPGDADLDALVGGGTIDAAVLEFDFECPSTNVISFEYVFSSEEYDEFVATQYNDVFAFFLNGQNIALIPNTNLAVAIGNVNCGNPYAPPGGQNCSLYLTNDCNSIGLGYPCFNLQTEMDGMTVVFTATGTLQPGPNHIKLAIADRADGNLDSNVFIRGESFTCGPGGPVFDPPSPCGQTLLAAADRSFDFQVHALAANGLPGQSVVLTVAGDANPLAGGTFTPPLPAGPASSVATEFQWTPTSSDIGLWHLQFTATDQIQQTSTCDVWIDVAGLPAVDLCQPGVGSVLACPCSNPPGTSVGGCDNSDATGGAILASVGRPSLAQDSVLFTTSGETADVLSIVMQGTSFLPNGVVYGQGIRCVGGTLKRLYSKNAVGDSLTAPDGNESSVSVRSAALGDPIGPGTSRTYLVFYRDPNVLGGCPPTSTFNGTQTQQIVWTP